MLIVVIHVHFQAIGNSLLEEVGLALHGGHVDEVKQVCYIAYLLVPQQKQSLENVRPGIEPSLLIQ